MEAIGLFQLENLMISRSPFLFIDLRESQEQMLPEPLAGYLRAAKLARMNEILKFVEGLKISKHQPILLICENGKLAEKAARDLEVTGYSNVYIVAGGVLGLLSEL